MPNPLRMTVQKIKKQHILKELRSYSDVQEILPQNLAVFEFLYSRAQSIWHQKKPYFHFCGKISRTLLYERNSF